MVHSLRKGMGRFNCCVMSVERVCQSLHKKIANTDSICQAKEQSYPWTNVRRQIIELAFEILLYLGMIFLLSMMVPPILLNCLENIGGFHLHHLVFPFVYQFYTRMTAQVESTFWKSSKLFIFIAFHNHFKIYLLSCYWKWEASFDSIYFEVQKNHN